MAAIALNIPRSDRWTAKAALLALAGLTLAACASTTGADRQLLGQAPDAGAKGEPTSRYTGYRVGKPYQVKGVWYAPKDQPNYDEVGIASWYGEQFHNKYTADGEVFDMNMPSAAHKTLPLPSLVEVTNLTNGKTVILRVNDRGPFVDGRILDLSKAAAAELGFQAQGVTKVRVRYVGRALDPPGSKSTPDWLDQSRQQVAAAAPPPSQSKPQAKPAQSQQQGATQQQPAQQYASRSAPPDQTASSASKQQALPDVDQLFSSDSPAPVRTASAAPTAVHVSYDMQIGTFPSFDSAQRFALTLTSSGLPEVQTTTGPAGQAVYRVVVHGLSSPAEAAAVQAQASALGAPQTALAAGS